jgi:hypothetical protein
VSDPSASIEPELPAVEDGSIWVLTLRSEKSDIPEAARMERLLKCVLRAYSFRCVSITDHVPPTAKPSGEAAP